MAMWFLAVDAGDIWVIYVTGIVSFFEKLWGDGPWILVVDLGSWWWTWGEEWPFGKAK